MMRSTSGLDSGLSIDIFLREAEKAVGLSDYGDRRFLDPMQEFVEAVVGSDMITAIGSEGFRRDCLRFLVNRLGAQADL